MKVFVTGAAGFIGFHLARRLTADGHDVTGYDGLTTYYDVALKEARLKILEGTSRYRNVVGMLEDAAALRAAIAEADPDVIVHLAAQAGVRYSLEHPEAYANSNLVGTFNLLEAARAHPPKHLLIASTSSVYGGNRKMPFAETDLTAAPLTLYAASKAAGESMSHAYAHLFSIPTTCLRFFTVYGPWGRPDMAPFKFAEAISEGRPIDVFGHGQMRRDFTYVDDVVESIVRLAGQPPELGRSAGDMDSLSPIAPWRVVNVAGGQPVGLMDFIAAFETSLGRKAVMTMKPMQPGDVVETLAATDLLRRLTGFVPQVAVPEGVAAFVAWYRDYRKSAG